MRWSHVHHPSFFSNDTPTTEIYTLSLHDALPILASGSVELMTACDSRTGTDSRSSTLRCSRGATSAETSTVRPSRSDRKSTRLNSSHSQISYAVFCLKKKKQGGRQRNAGEADHVT